MGGGKSQMQSIPDEIGPASNKLTRRIDTKSSRRVATKVVAESRHGGQFMENRYGELTRRVVTES